MITNTEYIFQGSLTGGWNERNGDTGDWNGSTSPRKEFGGGRGFISDNWRRHRGGGEDEDGWRTATSSRSDKWGRLQVVKQQSSCRPATSSAAIII